MTVIFMCSACQDNMHVTLRAKCILYACQNKGRMHSTCSRGNRQVTCMFHVTWHVWCMLKKVYVLSISYRFSFSRRLNVCWPHPTSIYMGTYTCTQMRKAFLTSQSPVLILNCFTHVICMSCNMHVACMEKVPNPCMLHEICMPHACRYKWNLHITCANVSACHHLKYACNMHKILYRECTYWGKCLQVVHERLQEGRHCWLGMAKPQAS